MYEPDEQTDESVEIRCEVPAAVRTLFLRPNLPNGLFSLSYLALEYFLVPDGLSVYTQESIRVTPRLVDDEFAVYLAPPGPYFIVSEVDATRATSTADSSVTRSTSGAEHFQGSPLSHSTPIGFSDEPSANRSSLDDVLQYLVHNKYPEHWVESAPTKTVLKHWKRALRKRAANYTYYVGDGDEPVLVQQASDSPPADAKRVLQTAAEVCTSRRWPAPFSNGNILQAEDAIRSIHGHIHIGRDETTRRFLQRYSYENAKVAVRNFIASCPACQTKSRVKLPRMRTYILTREPFEMVRTTCSACLSTYC